MVANAVPTAVPMGPTSGEAAGRQLRKNFFAGGRKASAYLL